LLNTKVYHGGIRNVLDNDLINNKIEKIKIKKKMLN
jgi:hypothetical protein